MTDSGELAVARRLKEDPNARDRVLAGLPDMWPWTRCLPASDRARLVDELVETTVRGDGSGSAAAVHSEVRQWQNTALVWAHPELLTALTAEMVEGGSVPRPNIHASGERNAAKPVIGDSPQTA